MARAISPMSPDNTQYLDHPSDIGIEAHGATCGEAFDHAASALLAIILDPSKVQSTLQRLITIDAADTEQLLVRWLSEILYLYDGQGFVVASSTITRCTQTTLEAVVSGEPFDATRHPTRMDVKAVTYHQLSVRQDAAGWHLRVFLDI
jgi:SHS2 domain-containing protein